MKLLKLKNIRAQLLSAFIAAAILVAVLQAIGTFTIGAINSRVSASAEEIQSNLDDKIRTLNAQLEITQLSDAIDSAMEHKDIQAISPNINLSQTAGDRSNYATIQSLITDLHKRKGAYLQTSEQLQAEITRYRDEVEKLDRKLTETVADINQAAIGHAEQALSKLSEETRTQSDVTLGDMKGTVNTTLQNVIKTLQLRNQLYAFELSSRRFLNNRNEDELSELNEKLAGLRKEAESLPSSVAGDFEIAAIKSLLSKIETSLTAEVADTQQLDQHFDQLQGKLLEIADNVVFDSSFELESYLDEVRTTMGTSINGLISTQEALKKALITARELQSAGNLIYEELTGIVFLLQRTMIERSPAAVSAMEVEVASRIESIYQARAYLDAELKGTSTEGEEAFQNQIARLVEKAQGDGGLVKLAGALVENHKATLAAQRKIDSSVSTATVEMAKSFQQLSTETAESIQQNLAAGIKGRNSMTALGLSVLLLSVGMGIVIPRRISNRISRIVKDLVGVADMLARSAGSITASSNKQATSASEQAATLEESSATIVGLSKMASKNAETTRKAAQIFEKTRLQTSEGTDKMNSMQSAMKDIVDASKQIEKIIKTIEEIAFQTNILALNAAVEAARAGEAGAGFGVVAEEVRSLAQKCTEAAKDTSKIIQSNEDRTASGMNLCNAVAGALEQITTQVDELNSMVSEISRATTEQSEGIEQLNTGVQSMSAKTQENAAVAEESAATSHELDKEAKHLQSMVENLREIAGCKIDELSLTGANDAIAPALSASSSRSHADYRTSDFSPSSNGNGHHHDHDFDFMTNGNHSGSNGHHHQEQEIENFDFFGESAQDDDAFFKPQR